MPFSISFVFMSLTAERQITSLAAAACHAESRGEGRDGEINSRPKINHTQRFPIYGKGGLLHPRGAKYFFWWPISISTETNFSPCPSVILFYFRSADLSFPRPQTGFFVLSSSTSVSQTLFFGRCFCPELNRPTECVRGPGAQGSMWSREGGHWEE